MYFSERLYNRLYLRFQQRYEESFLLLRYLYLPVRLHRLIQKPLLCLLL